MKRFISTILIITVLVSSVLSAVPGNKNNSYIIRDIELLEANIDYQSFFEGFDDPVVKTNSENKTI